MEAGSWKTEAQRRKHEGGKPSAVVLMHQIAAEFKRCSNSRNQLLLASSWHRTLSTLNFQLTTKQTPVHFLKLGYGDDLDAELFRIDPLYCIFRYDDFFKP